MSPLVNRNLSVAPTEQAGGVSNGLYQVPDQRDITHGQLTILFVQYKATTNRMLRVAVNGFMESLSVVLDVMEHLDVDVLDSQGSE